MFAAFERIGVPQTQQRIVGNVRVEVSADGGVSSSTIA
jgi:hypothetical protein